MDENVLLEWKEAHAEVYAKFKEDLERQLAQPYHQTILELGDDCAEPLKSVLANLISNTSDDGIDADKLYAKATESGDVSAYCLCCYLVFDNGADRLLDALEEKTEEPGTQEIIDAIGEYKRFYNRNRRQESAEVTTKELNLLTLRRWHYDHPQEYADFTTLFQKAYDGDMTFINNNFFFLMEFLPFKGVKGMMKVIASMVPGNKHHEQAMTSTESSPLNGKLAEQLNLSLNNEAIRDRLLHKNPYLFSLYYWIIFDNGFLHAADLISQTFLKPDSPFWQRFMGQRAVEALISTSIDKAHYSKAQWKEVSKKIKKGEAKQVIDTALLEVEGRRGRKSTYVLLEEMLPAEHVSILAGKIRKILREWKQLEETDSILAYIFAALVKGGLTNGEYNYRTFHAAMQEKFPDFHIKKGFNWVEALYNAIIDKDNECNIDISDDQIRRGRKHATDVKLRLLSATNPNIE